VIQRMIKVIPWKKDMKNKIVRCHGNHSLTCGLVDPRYVLSVRLPSPFCRAGHIIKRCIFKGFFPRTSEIFEHQNTQYMSTKK